jgi:hypothetical protein
MDETTGGRVATRNKKASGRGGEGKFLHEGSWKSHLGRVTRFRHICRKWGRVYGVWSGRGGGESICHFVER